jgi:signal transduction histidine kinase
VRLEVSDRGLGIKRQNMPHIFEPFFTSNDEAQGAGLGLAIARELAERMHGELTVRSVPAGRRSRWSCRMTPQARALASRSRRRRRRRLQPRRRHDGQASVRGRHQAETTRVEVVEGQGTARASTRRRSSRTRARAS